MLKPTLAHEHLPITRQDENLALVLKHIIPLPHNLQVSIRQHITYLMSMVQKNKAVIAIKKNLREGLTETAMYCQSPTKLSHLLHPARRLQHQKGNVKVMTEELLLTLVFMSSIFIHFLRKTILWRKISYALIILRVWRVFGSLVKLCIKKKKEIIHLSTKILNHQFRDYTNYFLLPTSVSQM